MATKDDEGGSTVIVTDAATLKRLIERAVRDALERSDALPPEWLDAEGAAELLGVTPRTVQNLARRGELASTRVGRAWRFRRADVVALLEPDAAA